MHGLLFLSFSYIVASKFAAGVICQDSTLKDTNCQNNLSTCLQKCATSVSPQACKQGCYLNCDDCTVKVSIGPASSGYSACVAKSGTCATKSACVDEYNALVQYCIELATQEATDRPGSVNPADCGPLKTDQTKPSETDCNGKCVDTSNDAANCGACGNKVFHGSIHTSFSANINKCRQNYDCVSGTCQDACIKEGYDCGGWQAHTCCRGLGCVAK